MNNHNLFYENKVYVRRYKYILGPTQSHFNPLKQQLKWALRRVQNMIMPKKIFFILEGLPNSPF